MLYKNIHYFFMDLFGEELLDYYIEEKRTAFNKEIKIVKFNPEKHFLFQNYKPSLEVMEEYLYSSINYTIENDGGTFDSYSKISEIDYFNVIIEINYISKLYQNENIDPEICSYIVLFFNHLFHKHFSSNLNIITESLKNELKNLEKIIAQQYSCNICNYINQNYSDVNKKETITLQKENQNPNNHKTKNQSNILSKRKVLL